MDSFRAQNGRIRLVPSSHRYKVWICNGYVKSLENNYILFLNGSRVATFVRETRLKMCLCSICKKKRAHDVWCIEKVASLQFKMKHALDGSCCGTLIIFQDALIELDIVIYRNIRQSDIAMKHRPFEDYLVEWKEEFPLLGMLCWFPKQTSISSILNTNETVISLGQYLYTSSGTCETTACHDDLMDRIWHGRHQSVTILTRNLVVYYRLSRQILQTLRFRKLP